MSLDQGTLPGPSNVVPFWVLYVFLARTLIRTTKKVLHWRVKVNPKTA